MAEDFKGRVNERLYYCRLHLDWFDREVERAVLPRRVIEGALGDSAFHHLLLAYRAYLAEIASDNGLPAPALVDASGLIAALAAIGRESAEASHLNQLESSSSWLSTIIRFDRQPPQPPASSVTLVKGDIPLLQQSDRQSVRDEAEHCLTELQALIDSQRGCLEEW